MSILLEAVEAGSLSKAITYLTQGGLNASLSS